MAMLISLVALSIDAMLPALPRIGSDFGVAQGNETQMVVVALFVGLGVGQLLYGPASDSIGRKPAIVIGNVIFVAGCLVCIAAPSFEIMLLGRVLQGLGAAGNRTVIMAIVRDLYEGRMMARIMSFIMAVFIMVPAMAPALGQGILFFAGWRAIFVMLLLVAVIACLWLVIRQPESLKPQDKKVFSAREIAHGFRLALGNRVTFWYTIATGLVFAPFLGYLNSAQQIFQGPFEAGALFPAYFASLVLATGTASIVNGAAVLKFGMRRLSRAALGLVVAASLIFLPLAISADGVPSLGAFLVYMSVVFFCVGMLFSNMNVLAMEPMAHNAGTAAAVISALSSAIAIPLGLVIGQAFDNTVLPLAAGFAICHAGSLAASLWADRYHPMRPIDTTA